MGYYKGLYIYTYYLVGGLEHLDYFSIQLGSSSSQLLLTHIFQDGWYSTNQYIYIYILYDTTWLNGDHELSVTKLAIGLGFPFSTSIS